MSISVPFAGYLDKKIYICSLYSFIDGKEIISVEDAEFVPYKHMFRRADAVMPSDMVFPNIDPSSRAMMSESIIKGLLKKRLNYKGCVIGAPLHKSRIKNEAAAALKMIHCGVEMIMAPRDSQAVLDMVEREFDKGNITKECYEAMMNYEVEIDD